MHIGNKYLQKNIQVDFARDIHIGMKRDGIIKLDAWWFEWIIIWKVEGEFVLFSLKDWTLASSDYPLLYITRKTQHWNYTLLGKPNTK